MSLNSVNFCSHVLHPFSLPDEEKEITTGRKVAAFFIGSGTLIALSVGLILFSYFGPIPFIGLGSLTNVALVSIFAVGLPTGLIVFYLVAITQKKLSLKKVN